MDDPAWRKAEATTRFLDMKNGDPAEVATSVQCLLTPGHLVLGVRCGEPQMDKLKTNVTADGDANTWNDDSVEIFVDAGASGTKYLQVMVSAAGFGYSTWMPEGGKGPIVKIAASKGADSWTVEVAIPLAALGQNAMAKGEWGLHVCRNRKPVRATYFWAWVGTSNHTPTKYGRLVLG
jgi:hypothetical protein